MKKLLGLSTAAIIMSTAGVVSAASNPFSDVPADSWAYDAVATLSADGVIDGYPDGTYKGGNTMTRFEMAQIVARAMAKTDIDKADKALVINWLRNLRKNWTISVSVWPTLKRRAIMCSFLVQRVFVMTMEA